MCRFWNFDAADRTKIKDYLSICADEGNNVVSVQSVRRVKKPDGEFMDVKLDYLASVDSWQPFYRACVDATLPVDVYEHGLEDSQHEFASP